MWSTDLDPLVKRLERVDFHIFICKGKVSQTLYCAATLLKREKI